MAATTPEPDTTPDHADRLPATTRRLHRALLTGLLETGAMPSPETLAQAAGGAIAAAAVAAQLRTLAAADYLALDAGGRVTCLYPLSPTPTAHVVVIDGRRRFAMCAIDALGIPAMLGREAAIESRCGACGAPIALSVRPGAVATAVPATSLVVARRDEAEPAVNACCPFTLFACGPADAAALATRWSGTAVLPLTAALAHAESLFGDLLAPTLPATRRRGRAWSQTDHG